MIFSFHSDIVSITEQGESVPEIRTAKKKENFRDIIEYVYWNYDRQSMYHSMVISDRMKVIRGDKFSHLSDDSYKMLAKDSEALVKKLNMLQFTPDELLIEKMNNKISEYLEFWGKTKIKEDNHKLVADTIERAEVLLKMKERLMNIVSKDKATRRMGSGASTMIEEGIN